MNSDSFEANWILELDPALDPSLGPNWFFLQNGAHVSLESICHFLVLDPHLKAVGSNLWLSTNRIALFHWTHPGTSTFI
jgi:hypothetical protein